VKKSEQIAILTVKKNKLEADLAAVWKSVLDSVDGEIVGHISIPNPELILYQVKQLNREIEAINNTISCIDKNSLN